MKFVKYSIDFVVTYAGEPTWEEVGGEAPFGKMPGWVVDGINGILRSKSIVADPKRLGPDGFQISIWKPPSKTKKQRDQLESLRAMLEPSNRKGAKDGSHMPREGMPPDDPAEASHVPKSLAQSSSPASRSRVGDVRAGAGADKGPDARVPRRGRRRDSSRG